MKKHLIIFLSAILFSGLFSISHSLEQFNKGDFEGNGGDFSELEFRLLATEVVYELQYQYPFYFQEISKIVHRFDIKVFDELSLNGSAVTAINFPEEQPPLLHLSKSAWGKTPSKHLKKRIVLHELLWLAGINDSNYEISNRINLFNFCEFNRVLVTAAEISLNKSCMDIEMLDLIEIRTLDIVNLYQSFIPFPTAEEMFFFMGVKDLSINWPSLESLPEGIFKKLKLDSINIEANLLHEVPLETLEKIKSAKERTLSKQFYLKDGKLKINLYNVLGAYASYGDTKLFKKFWNKKYQNFDLNNLVSHMANNQYLVEPLFDAAFNCNLKMAKLLVELGADPKLRYENSYPFSVGATPADVIYNREEEHCAETLRFLSN